MLSNVTLVPCETKHLIMDSYPPCIQIICDGGNLSFNIEAKWPGSVHDSRIFEHPHWHRGLHKAPELYLPEGVYF